jgi:hypothetical protein
MVSAICASKRIVVVDHCVAKHIENYTIEVLLTRVDEFKRLALLVASDTNRARQFLPQLAKQAKDLVLHRVFARYGCV